MTTIDEASTGAGRAPDGGEGSMKSRGRPHLAPLLALRPYLERYRLALAGTLLSLLAAAAATLVLPLGVRRIIDVGFSRDDGSFVDQYFGVMLLIGFVLAVASAARFYAVTWLGERVVTDLSADVFGKLTRASPSFYEQSHSGEMMSRLTADTTQIKSAVGAAFSQAMRNIVLLVGALVMMFVTSASLSVLVLVAIPLIVLPLVLYGRVVKRLSRRAQDWLAESSAYASENLAAARTMQAYTHEAVVEARFRGALERSFTAAVERMRARAGLTAIAMFLVYASVIAILWYGATSVVAGALTPGHLGQFVLYAVFAAGALAGLSEIWGEVSQAAGAMERLSEILRLEPEIRSPATPVALPTPPLGRVEFRGVSFRYPGAGDRSALDGVSFTVEPGETIAIVGASGAGKSTVFNLLLRFYDVSVGAVLVDGVDVRRADVTELRRRFSLVPQEVALFADTVAENIRYGSTGVGFAEVAAAAEAAQSSDFIAELPDRFETRLGERGITLSGGQRQRVAIARAILRDAPILLLDEATSALDAESEARVQRALDEVMRNRTTLVIAHRLATVQRADRILVMEAGRIVDVGTHAALSQRDGLYKRLADLQFRSV